MHYVIHGVGGEGGKEFCRRQTPAIGPLLSALAIVIAAAAANSRELKQVGASFGRTVVRYSFDWKIVRYYYLFWAGLLAGQGKLRLTAHHILGWVGQYLELQTARWWFVCLFFKPINTVAPRSSSIINYKLPPCFCVFCSTRVNESLVSLDDRDDRSVLLLT